ncbi:MAG: sigma-70 family RNA polymerase sigma factor [Desulfobacterales bacterium]|nr:sigma-70 family RNA polymerase sigma factor [Desulfobacterales bacterium]
MFTETTKTETPELNLTAASSVPGVGPKETEDEGTKEKKTTAAASSDALQRYMFDIRKHHLLTREEEISLARRVQENGDQAAVYQLVVCNLRLVVKIAMKFQRFWKHNMNDLIQEGNIGLLRAAQKYDPNRNVKFSYYAAFWIKAYILKYIQDNFRVVKIVTTEGQRKLFFKLRQEKDKLASQGIDPTPARLAQNCGVSENDITDMDQRLHSSNVFLDAPLNTESNTEWLEVLESDDESTEEQVSKKQMSDMLRKKIGQFRKTMTYREKNIFDKRIYSETPQTLQEIGNFLGISRERVRQIEREILLKIKDYIKKELPDYEELAQSDMAS